jgi:hypothetical protein
LPNIHDEITSVMMKEPPSPDLQNTSALNLVVRSSDIARYQAVHEELVKQIFDAGLQEVWFDPELGGDGVSMRKPHSR